MKTILYIGNHLSRGGAYPSVAESLAPRLLPDVELHLVSRQRKKLLRLLHMLWAVLRYGRQQQPVVMDVYSTLNFWYALLCGLACRWMRIRYCCVLHGGNLPERLQKHPVLCRWLFGGAWQLIAPSGYLRDAFQRAGYEAIVIPNAISIENYPFKLRKQLQPRLLWVRAFDATYHPQMAIRVLHALAREYPGAELCMVGPDKDGSRADCDALSRELGIAGQVRFTGSLPKSEWIALAADYDIFINTTNFDNTPVSVIEAMALGLPVVSTNVGGVPYLIEEEVTGLLVPKGEMESFVRQLLKLIENQYLAEKLSLAGRARAETFSWEQVKPLWLNVLAADALV